MSDCKNYESRYSGIDILKIISMILITLIHYLVYSSVAENQKLLSILYQLRDILPKERERRICDDNIGLLQQLYALGASEITVALEIAHADFLWVWNAISVLVSKVFKPNSSLAVIATEKVSLLILVTSRDKAFQSQVFKLVREIMEEVADTRIVAVA